MDLKGLLLQGLDKGDSGEHVFILHAADPPSKPTITDGGPPELLGVSLEYRVGSKKLGALVGVPPK